MSLDRTDIERICSGDERRVSFSLPRHSRKEKYEAIAKMEEGEEIEVEPTEYPSLPETTVKHKKKWKIKLPWKKKKTDYYNDEFQFERSNEETVDPEDEKVQDKYYNSESEKENIVDDMNSENLQLELEEKDKRPFTWYDQFRISDSVESDRKKHKNQNLHHAVSEDVLGNETHFNDTFNKTDSKQKNTKKKFRKYKQQSYSVDTSSDEETDVTSDKADGDRGSTKSRKVLGELNNESSLSKSHPNLIDESNENLRKSALKQTLNCSLGNDLDSVAIDSKDFNARKKEEYMKKSSSLPNFFKKKKQKKKDDFMKERKSLEGNLPVSLNQNPNQTLNSSLLIKELKSIQRHEREAASIASANSESTIAETTPNEGSKRVKKSRRSSRGIGKMSQSSYKPKPDVKPIRNESELPERVKKLSENDAVEKNVDENVGKKTTSQKNARSSTVESSIQYPVSESVSRARRKSKDKHQKKQDVKSSDSEKFPSASSTLKKESKKAPQEPNALSSTFPRASSARIRRKSYEEMINRIEEEMFHYSSDESSDTDGDQVDLSFNKLLDKDDLREGVNSDPDFKLRRTPDSDLSLSETELVYEPKILSNKIRNSQLPSTDLSSFLKRPTGAPPLPPKALILSDVSSMTDSRYISSSSVGESEAVKKKKLKKLPKVKSEHNSCTDSSLEDIREALYANIMAKRESKQVDNLRKLRSLSWKERGRMENLSLDLSDSDSPPSFSPPVPNNDLTTSASPLGPRETSTEMKSEKVNEESVNNFVTVTSATQTAKGLYVKEFGHRKSKTDSNNLAAKNNDALKGNEILSPPPPPSCPPPEDDPFVVSSMSSLASVDAEEVKPKYERSSISSPETSKLNISNQNPVKEKYTPVYQEDENSKKYKNIYDKNIWKITGGCEKEKVNSNSKVEPLNRSNNKSFESSEKCAERAETTDFMEKFVKENTVELQKSFPVTQQSTLERRYPDFSVGLPYISGTPQMVTLNQEESNSLKKQIVTFHLPPVSSTGLGTEAKSASSEYTVSYRDISSEDGEMRTAQSSKTEPLSSPPPVPKVEESASKNTIPKYSPLIQRQVNNMKLSTVNEKPPLGTKPQSSSSYMDPKESSCVQVTTHQTSQVLTSQKDTKIYYKPPTENFINITSPTPYSNRPAPLKSILRQPNKESYSVGSGLNAESDSSATTWRKQVEQGYSRSGFEEKVERSSRSASQETFEPHQDSELPEGQEYYPKADSQEREYNYHDAGMHDRLENLSRTNLQERQHTYQYMGSLQRHQYNSRADHLEACHSDPDSWFEERPVNYPRTGAHERLNYPSARIEGRKENYWRKGPHDRQYPYPSTGYEHKPEAYSVAGFEERQETHPRLVQTNIKYIDPRSHQRNKGFPQPVNALIPSTVSLSTSYSSQIERVEIDDSSSEAESDTRPSLPSYPPPPPRSQWAQQKEFLGELLTPSSRARTAKANQPPYLPQSYYTPTIVEVEGYLHEPESVYQNVIHASHV